MSAERDELADLIFEQDMCQHKGDARDVADALLAAGYRKPQQVTTVEELDALPVHSVVLDSMDGPVVRVGGWWHSPYRRFAPYDIALPATVLHVGGTE